MSALPLGNHVCTIKSARSSRVGGSDAYRDADPQIELEVGNDQGACQERIIYADGNGMRQVIALFKAAGLPVPKAEDQDESGKLTDECVARLVGKRVGVAVRVAGYVDPSLIDGDAENE